MLGMETVFRIAYTAQDGSRVFLGETFLNRSHAQGRSERLTAPFFADPSVVEIPADEDGIKFVPEED